jgi:septal ring factor EnvC (AmiA/AmiB activator)
MRICAILSSVVGFWIPVFGGVALLVLAFPPAQALEPETELRETREAIRDLERTLEERRAALHALENLLATAARSANESRRELRELTRARSRQAARVEEAQVRVETARERLEAERQAAAALVRDQWQRRRHPPRFALSDGQNRHQSQFSARVREAREQALAELHERLETLDAARAELAREQTVLVRKEERMREVVADLEEEEARRRAALAELELAIEDEALELDRLQRNAETLEAVIAEVEGRSGVQSRATERDMPERPAVDFAELKGELPLPAEGPVLRRFNESRGSGLRSRWRGTVLGVANGEPVRSVHAGEVVYADWMQGYGFLVIVDHEDGYLTLYSNLEEILVAEGEMVAGGEQLALAGRGSAAIAPGLYFEIRHNGGPLNPERWWPSH